MNSTYLSENRQAIRNRRKLARALSMAWPSGEALSIDLAEQGIEVTPRTCNRWRSGQTEPSYSMGEVLRELILQQLQNQIKAAQAGINLLQ